MNTLHILAKYDDCYAILISKDIEHEKIWVAKLELDDSNFPKVTNGFINLMGIQIPKQQ